MAIYSPRSRAKRRGPRGNPCGPLFLLYLTKKESTRICAMDDTQARKGLSAHLSKIPGWVFAALGLIAIVVFLMAIFAIARREEEEEEAPATRRGKLPGKGSRP